jgi:hypothetical protein
VRVLWVILDILRWVVVTLTAIIGLVGNWWDLIQTQAFLGISWYSLVVILFILVSLGTIVQQAIVNSRFSRSLPNIKVLFYDNQFGAVTHWNPRTKEILYAGSPIFTRLYIANDPKTSVYGMKANDVTAHIEVRDGKNKLIYPPLIGRWSDTDEIYKEGVDKALIEQISLPPNGRARLLDIGLKYLGEDEFYLYNNETPVKPQIPGFRDQDRKLGVGEYNVKVRVRGEKTDKTFNLRLINPGKEKVVSLIPIHGKPIPEKKDC